MHMDRKIQCMHTEWQNKKKIDYNWIPFTFLPKITRIITKKKFRQHPHSHTQSIRKQSPQKSPNFRYQHQGPCHCTHTSLSAHPSRWCAWGSWDRWGKFLRKSASQWELHERKGDSWWRPQSQHWCLWWPGYYCYPVKYFFLHTKYK